MKIALMLKSSQQTSTVISTKWFIVTKCPFLKWQ